MLLMNQSAVFRVEVFDSVTEDGEEGGHYFVFFSVRASTVLDKLRPFSYPTDEFLP